MIRSNYTRAFGADGLFVTLHEYGHGYHYVAVEPWSTYSCTNNSHGFTETENLSCAFVEGFADWLSLWVNGPRLTTAPYGGDYGLENNRDSFGTRTNPPAGGDGVRVEAAVAALLYDLVDGPGEPDSPTNTAGGEESWDGITYPASRILDLIRFCRLDIFTNRLSGADQLVYCLEGNTGSYAESRAFSTAWRSHAGVSYDQAVSPLPSSVVRRFWKYDFYGVLQ